MSTGDELGVVEEWLKATLTGDAPLGAAIVAAGNPHGLADVYFTEAPKEAGHPLVIYQHQGGPLGGAIDLGATFDVNTAGPGRVAVESSWVVKAVGDGISPLPLRPIVVRMDALLADKTGTVAGLGEVLACKRIGPVSYPEVDGSRRFRHRGGLYRIWSTA